jgi:uncharacterized protein (DUF362 family)
LSSYISIDNGEAEMEEQNIDNAVYIYKLEHACTPPSSEDMARSAYELLKALAPPLKNRVAIKPNVTVPADRDSGIVTHPDFVAGIIDYLLEMGISAGDIMVAEGGGSGLPPHGMDKHYGHSGYTAMVQGRGVRLVNLNGDESISVQLPQAEILKEIGIAKTVKSDDTFFINVPKYKTHNLAVTTLSMKNLMGTITPSNERHLCGISSEYAERQNDITPNGITLREEHLCRKLCDLSLASRPDLNIIDGVIGRDGTAFHHGKNIQTNLAIAGRSVVSVDAVGSYLMGFDPSGIGYLKIAAQRGLGIIDVEKIKLYEARDGQLHPCKDIARFMSRIPFEVLGRAKEARNILLNREMTAQLHLVT